MAFRIVVNEIMIQRRAYIVAIGSSKLSVVNCSTNIKYVDRIVQDEKTSNDKCEIL
jgi:hypothetical protein